LGLYVSELVQRIDPKHRRLRQFFTEEIASKLGVEFRFGLSPAEEQALVLRIAKLYQAPADPALLETEAGKALMDVNSYNNKAYRAINNYTSFKGRDLELPSATGFSNARSLARLYCAVAVPYWKPNGFSIVRNQALLPYALECVVEGKDRVNLIPSAFARGGFQLDPEHKFTGAFFHGGYGGSVGWGDTTHQFGFGFTPNMLEPDLQSPLRDDLLRAVYRSIFALHKSSQTLTRAVPVGQVLTGASVSNNSSEEAKNSKLPAKL